MALEEIQRAKDQVEGVRQAVEAEKLRRVVVTRRWLMKTVTADKQLILDEVAPLFH
jgi:hypothetical protein